MASPKQPGAPRPISFLFTGRGNDQTGLYSYRARYYNPAWGQFVSEDPIALRGGINVYQAGCGESGEPSPESIQTFQWRSKSLIPMSLMRKIIHETLSLSTASFMVLLNSVTTALLLIIILIVSNFGIKAVFPIVVGTIVIASQASVMLLDAYIKYNSFWPKAPYKNDVTSLIFFLIIAAVTAGLLLKNGAELAAPTWVVYFSVSSLHFDSIRRRCKNIREQEGSG